MTEAFLFDPGANELSATGSPWAGRKQHTATLLQDGRVIFIGGCGEGESELFDGDLRPGDRRFSPGPHLILARARHTAILLRSGRVLVTGDYSPEGATATTELVEGVSAPRARPQVRHARGLHSAHILPNGGVLIAGGYDSSAGVKYPPRAELFIED